MRTGLAREAGRGSILRGESSSGASLDHRSSKSGSSHGELRNANDGAGELVESTSIGLHHDNQGDLVVVGSLEGDRDGLGVLGVTLRVDDSAIN
jgi:hypothetical protein